MSDDALCWAVEEACLNACPASRQLLCCDWLVRAAGGQTRRVNSVNPLRCGSRDPERVLGAARTVYQAIGWPVLFRVPSMAQAMDAPLERLGFRPQGLTRTLYADLDALAQPDTAATRLAAEPDEAWLTGRAQAAGLTREADAHFRAMLAGLALPRVFCALRDQDKLVAFAYGVLHQGLVVLEAVVTDPQHRGKGFGARTVGGVLAWARQRGARGACLQVLDDNAPALALYTGLGFRRELYRYHYRVAPAGA